MHYLFIDSTLGLVVGLLDSNFEWMDYSILDEKKPSEIIHFEIFSLLKKHKLAFSEITCFVASGPGSYTGMRLSEGLAQVFELSKIPVYSFYHFEVPKLAGIISGFWVTNAFKGQVFKHIWSADHFENQLINKENFILPDFTNGYTLDNHDQLFEKCISTKKLIFENPQMIFSKILNAKLRVAPYYFRALEEEFR